jgi:undecaprenyl-diphosphatase
MNPVDLENRRNRKYKRYVAGSIILLGLYIFYLCANGFMADLTKDYENFLLDWLGKTNKWGNSYGPASIVKLMDYLSSFASSLFVAIFTIVFFGYSIIRKKYAVFVTYFIVVFGAGIFHLFLKNIFGGEPWYNWLNMITADDKEFPSGHALMSVVFYFTLARIIYRAHPSRILNKYLTTVAFILSFSIGISQIIRGAHSPNDVIGGWAMGFVWISAAWLIDHKLRKKRYQKDHTKSSNLAET